MDEAEVQIAYIPEWVTLDRESYSSSRPIGVEQVDDLNLNAIPFDLELGSADFLVEEGDLVDDLDPNLRGEASKYPTCPPPTKWRVHSQQVIASRWTPVSAAVYAKAAPVRHTFRVSRTVTWGTTIESGYKANLVLVETQLGVKLETSVSVRTTDTLAYTVPKGATMCLFAAAGLVRRRISRTAYGSSMCTPVSHSFVVNSPYRTIIKVDRA